MRTILAAPLILMATQAVAEQSRYDISDCYYEAEMMTLLIEAVHSGIEATFDESLDAEELAIIISPWATRSISKAFDELRAIEDNMIEGLSVSQKTNMLLTLQRAATSEFVTSERIVELADTITSTDELHLIAEEKARYVKACVNSIEDETHFTSIDRYEIKTDGGTNSNGALLNKAQPKASSPPLTGGEKEAFKNQVLNCWAVNIGSRAANVSVIVSMDMQPDGKVVASSMEMIGFKDGNQSDANVAFQAARRAVLRCQKAGYDLPKEKYEHWRNIELTFDPNEMRKR